MPIVEILSQGHEVVTGQTVDTNAAWLSTQLTEAGCDVRGHRTVGDDLGDLVEVLCAVTRHADVVICTGGLGPTTDDLTSQAVSQAFKRELLFDAQALDAIRSYFETSGRTMPEINRKLAMRPSGSERIDNAWGTAPGYTLNEQQTWMVFLPGVPREMRPMFLGSVLPALAERYDLSPARRITFRTTGMGESSLQERMAGVERGEVVISYRTILPENHIKLLVPPHVDEADLSALVHDVAARLGSYLFAIEGGPSTVAHADPEGGSLEEVVGRELATQNATLSVAESCTGGQIATRLTAIPGASRWFTGGVVAYDNEVKCGQLGVNRDHMNAEGAVSEPVVKGMAEGVRSVMHTTFGLATSGVAGPDGGTLDKPVGTVHLALATPDETFHCVRRFSGDRARIQTLASAASIDLLRRHLQNLPLPGDPHE
jgi:nicotinamide-nucleotide amidase